VQDRMARRPDDSQFVLLTMARDKRQVCAEQGDSEGAAIEQLKRDRWHRENVLRRHNFVGLVYELVKRVSAEKSDSEWASTMDQARKKSADALRRE
jgi:ubiquitin carboxyl-terminal hydrolase L5